MPSAIVLGAGMVGSVMAADLAADFTVTIADAHEHSLAAAVARAARQKRTITHLRADLSDPATLKKSIAPFDIVIGALSSRIGFQSLRAVIEARKNFCDIAFFAEDALQLNDLAKEHNVTAVVDCGVAPGMSNMICGREVAEFERNGGKADSLAIYVGGLPHKRRWPFQYKAGFAPSDVIEEYTRPTRLVENGRVIVREALTEPEFLDFCGLGTLEAVNTDGLRSLATTFLGRVANMKEKTLRYPGHYELMRALKETGLFSEDEIEVGGKKIKPRDLTAALMFPKWTYQPGEEDLTVMRITVSGTPTLRGGSSSTQTVTWNLVDFFDKQTQSTSMSRTTGLACTAVARLIAAGKLKDKGVLPPERLGATPGILEAVLSDMATKNIHYTSDTPV